MSRSPNTNRDRRETQHGPLCHRRSYGAGRPPSGGVRRAAASMNTMRSIGVPQPPSAQRRVMIAPVSTYDGTDTDWGCTSPTDCTGIANCLEKTSTNTIRPNVHIVHTAGPNTVLLQMQLVSVESNVPVLSTV